MKLKNRERILIVLAAIAIAVWVFDILYYTPQSREMERLRAEIKAADMKLNESLVLAKSVETLEGDILRGEGELTRLSERTLKGNEFRTFLKHLGKESDPLQMKVISLTREEDKLPSTEGKRAISPTQYRKVSIQIVLHSTYAKVQSYLKGIEELPFLIHVESIQIERNEEVQPLLKMTIGLSMYVIEEPKGMKG